MDSQPCNESNLARDFNMPRTLPRESWRATRTSEPVIRSDFKPPTFSVIPTQVVFLNPIDLLSVQDIQESREILHLPILWGS